MRRAFLILALLIAAPCLAQVTGTKQTITIAFPKNPNLKMTEGMLLQCEKPNCIDAKPIYENGSSFNCYDAGCKGEASKYAPYLQLTIKQKDGVTITSAPFPKRSYDGNFTATLTGDTLEVMEQ
ncbi:MAG: hypothetical protein ACOYNL_02020 [Rickettsiales bacterium]